MELIGQLQFKFFSCLIESQDWFTIQEMKGLSFNKRKYRISSFFVQFNNFNFCELSKNHWMIIAQWISQIFALWINVWLHTFAIIKSRNSNCESLPIEYNDKLYRLQAQIQRSLKIAFGIRIIESMNHVPNRAFCLHPF